MGIRTLHIRRGLRFSILALGILIIVLAWSLNWGWYWLFAVPLILYAWFALSTMIGLIIITLAWIYGGWWWLGTGCVLIIIGFGRSFDFGRPSLPSKIGFGWQEPQVTFEDWKEHFILKPPNRLILFIFLLIALLSVLSLVLEWAVWLQLIIISALIMSAVSAKVSGIMNAKIWEEGLRDYIRLIARDDTNYVKAHHFLTFNEKPFKGLSKEFIMRLLEHERNMYEEEITDFIENVVKRI